MSSPDTEPASIQIVATDDDPSVLAAVTYTLRDAGYTVFALYTATSAYEAVVRAPGVDLLVANTRMPDMSIAELIRRVRERRPDVPILHIGEPLPDAFPGVANLREAWTKDQLLEKVRELVCIG
jgi:response regulator RpfG family c-di-GMP phosphodiesterase